jgi:N-carbamoyl-L-amino-acid hydrolase
LVTGPSAARDRRFLDDFGTLSSFGALPSGGVERQAGTAADGEQRRWLASWLRDRGFEVVVDGVGNLFGLRTWHPGAPYVRTGSHLDSQPNAGRFDGAYGVLASAHAAWRLSQHVDDVGADRFPLNVAVVDWFNEEGSRFVPSMMGSAVFTGALDLPSALETTDPDGTSVKDALADIGFLGDGIAPDTKAYAEIHVEQGRILERSGITIGLVDSTWAARKYEVVVTGEQSHTGSTVMADRRDALAAAAAFIVAARELADAYTRPALHTAVSQLTVEPNSPVVVARQVTMNFDLRCADHGVVVEADSSIAATVGTIEERYRVRIERRLTHEWDAQPYQAGGVQLAATAARSIGLSNVPIQTIAGHDSTNLKDIVSTVMLFVPSVDGIAHNVGELTNDDDCMDGVSLLTEVLARLCAGELGDSRQGRRDTHEEP